MGVCLPLNNTGISNETLVSIALAPVMLQQQREKLNFTNQT